MLDAAKRRLLSTMHALDREIRDGVPVVGLEPSCLSVFRDELINLFPASEQAQRLKAQTYTLAEMVERHAHRMPPARLERRALVHGHCHQKALVHMDADRRVLERIGVEGDLIDSGCCGMAGAFGFERAHYDVSMAAGERVLLPAVRAARRDTLIVADGFSCREQIAQGTGRRALHLAQVLQMAIDGNPAGPPGDLPEQGVVIDHTRARIAPWQAGAVAVAGMALLALGLGRMKKEDVWEEQY